MTPADPLALRARPVRAGTVLLSAMLVGTALLSAPSSPAPSAARAAIAHLHILASTGGMRRHWLIDHERITPFLLGSGSAAGQPPVVFSVGTSEPVVALTFDLDMTPSMQVDLRSGRVHAWIDRGALALLRSQHVPATLFMTGMWAETYPEVARELARSGQFEIANHSYSHPAFRLPCYNLGSLPAARLNAEVERAQSAIQSITGITPVYFRFPGGCFDPNVVSMVRGRGLTPIQWNLNSLDAFNASASQIAHAVISGVHPGSIVIMHLMGGPNAPASGAALRLIIPALEAKGYQFVTVGDLLGYGPALQPVGFNGIVEAAASPPAAPAATGPVSASAGGYWVWTPWGWQKLSHPPACRWQANPKTKTWVCV